MLVDQIIELRNLNDALRIDLALARSVLAEVTKERDQCLARAVALFWGGHADNKTIADVRDAAEKIEELLKT